MGIIPWLVLALAARPLVTMRIPGRRSQGLATACHLVSGRDGRRMAHR
jgi:hypothetical protein